MNKKLLLVVIILIPLTILSYIKKTPKKSLSKQDNKQYVDILYENKRITLELNDYVIGVVAAEMPALFEPEALKAQAVASRTFVMKHLENNDSITTTTASQVYISQEKMQEKWQDNFAEYYNKIKQAVLATDYQVLKYKDHLIKSYYYSMSNGYTESSLNVFNEKNDYLNVVESKWDEENSQTITMSKQEFCTKLGINCQSIEIKDIIKDESARIAKITINNQQYTGIQVRKLLNLRSTDFNIEINDNEISITTRGYGHGVGMSQYGANNMAKSGYKYPEILKYYYQNVEISNL